MRAASTVLLIVLLGAHLVAQGQNEKPNGVDVSELPLSVERIEEDLQTPSVLDLAVTRPLFRVEIVAPRPPDWLENIDWLGMRGRIGPTPQIPSAHEQYIARVTPREAQMWSAFEGTELLQVAITSFFQSLATQRIVQEVPDKLRARREEQARREVDEAIARWQKMVEEERKRRAAAPF